MIMDKIKPKKISLRKILLRLEKIEKDLENFQIQNQKDHQDLFNFINGKKVKE